MLTLFKKYSTFCCDSLCIGINLIFRVVSAIFMGTSQRVDFEVLKSTLENEKRDFERALGVIPDGLCFLIIKSTLPLKNMGVRRPPDPV